MTATRPSPRPRHRAEDDEDQAEPATETATEAGSGCKLCGREVYRRGLCRGHWDTRRGDADPKGGGRA